MIRTRSRIAGMIICAAPSWGSQYAAAERVPQWELGAGVVGLLLPDYRGSDEVRSYILPVPYIIYRLEWIKADQTGIHSKLLNWERAEVNLSLSATPPVRSKNNRAREGMSDLKPMVELGRRWTSTCGTATVVATSSTRARRSGPRSPSSRNRGTSA